MAKKTIIVTLNISEILYEVYNKTYLTGRSKLSSDNYKEIANAQADDDEENKSQILRSIGNAISYVHTKLSEYVNADCCGANSNKLIEENDVDIILNMPSNFNEMAAKTITTSIHQYIVNTAIGDFFLLTNKADAAEYLTQAASNIGEMMEAVHKRVRPTRYDTK